MRPSRPMTLRVGRFSSRHQVTSVTSPNVQIIAMPVPLSGWASGWATTGTSTSNSGVRTVVPNSWLVALVVWMGDEGDATDDQLRPRRFDQDVVDSGTAQTPSAAWNAMRW